MTICIYLLLYFFVRFVGFLLEATVGIQCESVFTLDSSECLCANRWTSMYDTFGLFEF